MKKLIMRLFANKTDEIPADLIILTGNPVHDNHTDIICSWMNTYKDGRIEIIWINW